MTDQIIDHNKVFIAQKGYEKYQTDKYPDKQLGMWKKKFCSDTIK